MHEDVRNSEHLKGKGLSRELGIDERLVLKLILKYILRVMTEFI
jgi:hypothetical protein